MELCGCEKLRLGAAVGVLILARQEAALQARQAAVRCFKRIRAERPARRRTAAASALAPIFDRLHRGLRR